MFAALCTKTSSTAETSGRPFRMRADHSWPQRRQLYQATIQVLSGAGSTDRPQAGQDIAAVVENVWNMAAPRATLVPTAAPHRTRQTPPIRVGRTRNYIRQRVKLRTVQGLYFADPFERTKELTCRSAANWHGWCLT